MTGSLRIWRDPIPRKSPPENAEKNNPRDCGKKESPGNCRKKNPPKAAEKESASGYEKKESPENCENKESARIKAQNDEVATIAI